MPCQAGFLGSNIEPMSTRLATPADHHDAIGWLRPDDPDRGVHVVVEERDGALVGAALRMPNALHPTLDALELAAVGAATVDLVRVAAGLATNDVVVRALPGTPVHDLATAAGATVLDRVPASRIDPSHPDVVAWARAHQGATRPGTDLTPDELTDLWVRHYVMSHQHFGVTDDEALVRARLGRFVERLVDPGLTRYVEVDGEPVALAVVFHEGPSLMALVDSLRPTHPEARREVEVAMAALLQAVPPEPFELDGHESSAHHPAVLATIPHVGPGPLAPMELLRLGDWGSSGDVK